MVAEVTGCDGPDDASGDGVSDRMIFVLLVSICKQTSTSPSSAHTPRRSCDLPDNLRVCCTVFDDLFYFPAPFPRYVSLQSITLYLLLALSEDWAPFLYPQRATHHPSPRSTRYAILDDLQVADNKQRRLCTSPLLARPAAPHPQWLRRQSQHW